MVIASRMLRYDLEDKRQTFFNFRHMGAAAAPVAPRFALAFMCACDAFFFVEHSRRNRKHCSVLVAGPRRFSLAKIATLRVTLRVSNFLSNPLKTRNAAKSRRMRVLIWRGGRGSNPRPPA